MNISSKIAGLCLLLCATNGAIAADLDPPVLSADINSDYGPRVALNPHMGIDYLLERGISIQSIEKSSITAISYGKREGWYIEASSIEHPGRKWTYMHLFSRTKMQSGLFRIFKSTSGTVIVRFMDINRITPIQGYTDKVALEGTSFDVPVGTVTRRVILTQIIGLRERIGPVGTSGDAKGPHLHIKLSEGNRNFLNPLLYLDHAVSNFAITPIYPVGGNVFPPDLLPGGILSKPIIFNINSTQGLDLNRVEVSVLGPNGAETFLGGYDYQGAQSISTYPTAATLRVMPQPKLPNNPPGIDQFQLQGARLHTSSSPAGNYQIKIRAFNIRGVNTEKLIPFTISDPIQGASLQIDSGTSTADYNTSSGKFLAQVRYTATSASGIRAHQLYTFTPNTSFTQVLATQDIPAGVAGGLSNGDYAIVVIDNADVATRLDFTLSTNSASLSTYLAGIHPAGTYERNNVVVATAAGQLPLSAVDVAGYLANPPLIAASPNISGEIFYPSDAPSNASPGPAVLGVAVTSVTAVTQNIGDPVRSLAYNSRIIFAGTSGIQEAGIPGFRYSNSHYETTVPDNTQPSGEELTLMLGGAQIASYKYTRGGLLFTGLAEDDNNPVIVVNAAGPIPLPKLFEAKLTFKPNAASLCREVDGTNFLCFNAGVASPMVDPADPFGAFGVMLESSLLSVVGTTRAFNVIDRIVTYPDVAVSFGASVGIARLQTNSFSSNLSLPRRLPAPSPQGVSLSLADFASGSTFNQNYTVSLPFVASELEAGQVANLRVIKTIGGQSSILTPTISANIASVPSASANPADLGSYELVVIDEIPPGPISIAFSETNEEALAFAWIASGGDGVVGQAASYDIRFGLCPSGAADFNDLPAFAPNEENIDSVPGLSGAEQGVEIGELSPDTNYCLGVKVFDLVGNSAGPYVVLGKTLPIPVTMQSPDLIAGQPELEFQHQSPVPLDLSKLPVGSPEWTQYKEAVANKFGVQPLSNIFNIGPSGTAFGQDAQLVVRYDPANLNGNDPDSLILYESIDDPSVAFPLPGQIHDRQNHLIVAAVRSLHSKFAIFGSTAAAGFGDVLPPRTTLTVDVSFSSSANVVFVSSKALLGFSTFDDKLILNDSLGGGTTQTFYSLDGGFYSRFTSNFSLVVEGSHAISFYSVDLSGNVEVPKTQSLFLDLTAPVTELIQNGSEVTLVASDLNGAGVSRIRYLVDYGNPEVCNNVAENTSAARGTCENPWYAGPFMLSGGPHTITFQAFDAVGNAESLQTSYPFVGSGGSGPSVGGVGIGKDSFNAFWTVISENALTFAHSNSSGALISSSTLVDAVSGFPWSVFFGPDGRAYAVGGAGGPATQALDLAVYKASPDGDAIESRTLFDSGYANNDIAFDAKAPGWIVGAAQTSGPTDLEAAGGGEFSMALWRFDPALGAIQLKTTYARAGFDLGAGLAVDSDGSLWVAGYSLSPEAPAVGGFDLALWHYAANGQTLLGGPFLRAGYLDNLDGGLTARVFVSSQAVYVAAPRANVSGATDMAFLRYDKATGLPTSEITWRSADGAPSYPIAILPEASGLLVAGGIGGNFTEAGLWRFGLDGTLQSVTTADAGGARGAVFQGSELWLSVDGSTVPYRVQAEAAAAGSLVDLAPPRTSLSAGAPSFAGAQAVYVTSATPLGFTVVDDYAAAGDGLGAGATQTFYAEGAGAFARFTSSFTLVVEGTHTVSFFSIDREGRTEAVKTQTVGVDLTAPVATLVSSGPIFSIIAVDPVVGGAVSGVGQIQYLVDLDPECDVPQSTAAAPGTCENMSYAGPFELAVGTHTVYYAATDRVLNGGEVTYSSFVTVAQPVLPLAVTAIAPTLGGNGGPLTVSVSGTGIVAGAGLSLNRLLAGSGFTMSGALVMRNDATAIRLMNGKVLIAGGRSGSNIVFSSAEIFDPNSGSWSVTGAMAGPRYAHTMTLLPNGKVLVAGGISCDNCGATPLKTAELYDPVSGTWSNTGLLVSARATHTATLLASGKVLVAGGSGIDFGILKSAELYNPESGVWTSAGVMPSGAHFRHSAAALPDGRVLIAGGVNASFAIIGAVDIYNPDTNTWSAAAPMINRRHSYTLNLLPSGKLLAVGGDAGVPLAATEIYDPAPGVGTWTLGAPLSSKRAVHTSARLSDGKILVIGGNAGSAGFVSAAELFDPIASSWTTVGSLPRIAHTETALTDGRILVAGGYDPAFQSVTSIYSPASVSIVASNLTYSDGNVINGVLDLAGQSLGLWDVVVTNPDQSSTRLSNAFTIYDTAPPSTVGDLAISTLGISTVTLAWTAPSGQGGAVVSYELRRATVPITTENFHSAASIAAPAPTAPGTLQTAVVALGSDSAVFVALRSQDIYGNVSSISNVASLARSTTLVNGVPEASIWATQPVSVVMSTGVAASIQSAAVAQGLAQVSSIYDPNPKSVAFLGSANAAFEYDPVTLSVLGVSAGSLQIYQFIGGTLVPLSSQVLSGRTVIASTVSFAGSLGLFGVVPAPTLTAISPTLGGNAGQLTVTVNGSGIVTGAGLALNRVPAGGSGFTTSGALAMRNDAIAIRLMNGKVLIAGGRSGSNIVFSSVEIFDPNSGSWSATGAMAGPRYGHTMTLLPNGKVLVAGGMSCDSCGATPLKTAELYDPVSGTWSNTGLLVSARANHTATLLASGKVLVAGGSGNDFGALKSAELYNPESGVWTSAGVMPSGAHFRHSAAALPDGRVLVAGGVSAPGVITGAVDIYNPDSNTWSLATQMINRRHSYTLNLLPSGKLLAVGGDAGVPLAATEIYDPAPGVGTWTLGAPLSSKRAVHTSARLSDGKILVIGGVAGSAGFVSAAELFDPIASSWTTVGSLSRIAHTETALTDGRILVAGGNDPAIQSVTTIYSPTSVSIVASSLTYSDGNLIGGVFELTGQSVGLWDVVVTNPNHLAARLSNAFTIYGASPPSAVTDLALSSIGLSTVTLQWTAPASPSGALASYEIRYAAFPLDSGNFASGTSVNGPAPASDGTVQSVSIGGLDGVTAFHVALKSRDIYGNASSLSNVASLVRSTTAIGGQPEITFSANVSVTVTPVPTNTAPGTVVLGTATAQGLTLVSSIYDLGPEGAVFNPFAQMTFVYSPTTLASLGLLPGDVKIYQYVSGVGMVAVSSQTIDTAANTITGYVPSLSSIFAVFGVIKDRAAPVTSLTPGANETFKDGFGNLYASPTASLGFIAYDPVVFGAASGVARTNYRVDGSSTAPFFLYSSTFSLISEGQRTLWFYSEDYAGNVEVARSSGVLVDAAVPITTLQVIGSSVTGVTGGLTVSSTTTLALLAADPVSNGVASGVGGIFYALDANPASPYGGPFILPPGAHSISYFSKDNVANAETTNVLSILIDTVAPQSTLLVNGVAMAGPAIVMVSTDSVGLSASDAGAGIAQIQYSLDGAAEQVYISTFSLSAGSHNLAYRGVDRLGNAETAHQVALDVLLYDVTPPTAALSIVDQSTITTNAPVIVATYDDGGRGVDASSVRLTLDGVDVTAQAAVSASSMTFSPALSQGAHDFSITFADFAGNRASAAAIFFVDSVPPVTILQVDGVAASTTALVIVSTNTLGFASLDAGTGVAQTLYSLDGAASAVYNSTFSVGAGVHSLTYHSIDKVGNVESSNNIAFTVLLYDVTPPSLVLAPVTGSTVTTATPQIAAVYFDAGRGVDASSVRINLDGLDVTSEAVVSASSAVFIPSAALSQAAHTVVIRVSDLAGNQSVAVSTFLVDSLPPVTTLLLDGLATSATGLVLISTNSMGFSAMDAGTGVFQTRYSLDGSPTETVYVSTFGLTAGEHTLTYRSFDLGGNAETAKIVSVSVFEFDVTPPTLALTPSHGSTVTVATPLISALYGDLGRGIDASSVKVFLDGVNATAQAIVTTSSAVFTPGADLAQGAHIVTAEVVDFAGNRSSAAATFLVDSVAPVTTLLVNGLAAFATDFILVSTDSIGFSALDAGVGTAETRYVLDGSTNEAVYVSPFNLAVGIHILVFHSRDFAGNVEAARMTSIRVLVDDATPPSLTLAPVNGSTITTTTPEIRATYSDLGRGVDLFSIQLTLDGQEMTSLASITASSASFTPTAALSQGTHTVTARVSDLAGNASSALATFRVDSLPPITTLLINGLASGSANLVLASTDAVSFAAADSGVGVLETRYSVDGSSEAVFTASFLLSPGSNSLAFHSRDRAGNMEAAQVVSVVVTTPSSDTIPPLVRLDVPGASALGVEQALGGVVNVRGGVSDASALTWTLEAAPGASAAGGFATIASGAGNLSGLIAAWNTTSLSGYQTVRLRATDAFGNSALATATVFVGSPVFTFAIGRKDSNVIVNTIKGPTGIAVRSDGAIWVASTENDKILLLSPAGVLLGEAGQGPGHSGEDEERGKKEKKDKEDEDHDDKNHDDGNSGGLSFKSPQGLTLDAAGHLYVADRDLNRVAKLSPDGQVLLLKIGKPGSGPGELKRPFDVAVDGNGDVYVADSGNRRIEVFNASGIFLRQFGQGALPTSSEVRGIALTSEGLWVSDKESERIYLFSRAGDLIKSIGGADSVVGEISRTRGLVADRLGALYVVEPNRDRAQKFDPQGKGLLAFGSKAGLSHADKLAKRYLTQPIDAAIAPDGSIWLTDTGRDRIVRYALPVSGGYGVAAYAAGGGAVSSSSVEPARRVVDRKDGAKVERDDGAGVHVPKDALVDDLEITVDKGDENQDKEEKTAKRREMKITAVSEEVQYGPEGTTFNAPVTLTLPYDANLIAAQGIREDELKVYYWNPTLKDWQAMPSTVDKQNKTVNAQTTHFSAYQVGGLGGVGVAAIDDFGLRDGYAFPNPSRNGSAVTFRMQPGSVDSIEVRVYDLSGRKIHSSSDFRFLGAFDDGNGKGNQNTYDHVWSVSGIGSGVYTYVMTAKKTGQSDIRKTGKVGVIK